MNIRIWSYFIFVSIYGYDSVYVYIPGPRDAFVVTDLGEYLINLRKSGKLFLWEQGVKSGKQNRRKTLEQDILEQQVWTPPEGHIPLPAGACDGWNWSSGTRFGFS